LSKTLSQSSFDFPFLDHYLDDDFLSAPENSKAFEFISNYNSQNKDLPNIFVISGKRFCGKTHLACIWQRKLKAEFLKIDSLEDFEAAGQIEENCSYIIENIEEISNQTVLFHIFNIAAEKNCNLMLTSGMPINQIKYDFADLSSRLKNVFAMNIADPDIEFIQMLLIKQFALRQLRIDDRVIDYIAKNIDRSYESVVQISKLLEFYCFEKKKTITVPFVSEVLKSIKNPS
jgi:chromosomal replication initiation ATPase DnaA